MKYPIGIQTFEKLRDDGYVYVDKTALLYELASNGGYYFLSRPRRFGKSLLVSTLKAYFEGRADLFKGLAIESLEKKWEARPVLHLDLNGIEPGRPESLDILLDDRLRRWEEEYSVGYIADNFGTRFANVIRQAYKQSGRRVAILIDEYDKPILNLMEQGKPRDEVRARLKGFYSVLKSEDQYIRFALLTGVTRFSKVSVFSDLNNLRDISMDPAYATLCGVSEDELHGVFDTSVEELAKACHLTKAGCYDELRHRYDGYHFAYNTPGMYNPFSLLNTFQRRFFDFYWFATGTPTFLAEAIQHTGFDFTRDLSEPVSADLLADVDTLDISPLPILFQAGYLTIKDYDPRFREYTLRFPNVEVREGFIRFLLPRLTQATRSGDTVSRLIRSVESGNCEAIVDTFKTLFDRSGNYMLYEEKSKERDFRNILYMAFSLLDIYTQAELCTAHGRMDLCVETKDYVYVIELKLDQTAQIALDQIRTQGYARRFDGDARQLILLGLNFSTKTNTIDDWAQG